MSSSRFWEEKTAAERYAASRPYFHQLVVERMRDRIGEDFTRALDVACGTGLSTVPLLDIADEVYGADISSGMLAVAPRHEAIAYVEASAEDLPFDDGHFDLLTVSSGLHWLDREAFLAEAARVLRPAGHLIVYDHRFTGRMSGNPEYERWLRGVYSRAYPSPPRNREPLSREGLSGHGFELSGKERFENEVRYSVEGFSDYLMTQSNFIAAVKSGSVGEDELRAWLVESQAPFFPGSTGTFEFEGEISFVRKRRV